MSPLPLTMSRILVEQRQANLRANAARRSYRRPRRRGRLRRWASGWFDRAIPGPARRPQPSM